MIHREGRKSLFIVLILLTLLYFLIQKLHFPEWITQFYLGFAIVLYFLVLQFFRNPKRSTTSNINEIIAPADGKIVIIEECIEREYLKDKRMLISIFMSPFNVHVNRAPISGKVVYTNYHPGKYLVAWNPKSSLLNERTSVVMENKITGPILFRQIAGAVARRIAIYCKPNQQLRAGEEFGFIRFGSRMDVFLPLNSEIMVKIGDKPVGGETVIARVLTDSDV